MRSVPLALALLGVAGFAGVAAAQSYSQTQCRTVSSRGVYQSVCTRTSVTAAPRPSEPFRRGPGTVEVVHVPPQASASASASVPAPAPAPAPAVAPRQTSSDNFCGPGYRAARDGSCMSLSSER